MLKKQQLYLTLPDLCDIESVRKLPSAENFPIGN